MTTYFVERYLPGRDRAWLEVAHGARLDFDRIVAAIGAPKRPEEGRTT